MYFYPSELYIFSVVACGGDGFVKLWDVGERKLISNLVSIAGCPVNSCGIQATAESISLGERQSQTSELKDLNQLVADVVFDGRVL